MWYLHVPAPWLPKVNVCQMVKNKKSGSFNVHVDDMCFIIPFRLLRKHGKFRIKEITLESVKYLPSSRFLPISFLKNVQIKLKLVFRWVWWKIRILFSRINSLNFNYPHHIPNNKQNLTFLQAIHYFKTTPTFHCTRTN